MLVQEWEMTEGLQTLDAKREWNEHFEAYIRALDEKKGVIWAGDLNVAPGELGGHADLIWAGRRGADRV